MSELRITIVNGMRMFAGAEVWMLDTACGLSDRGHAVDLVAAPDAPLALRAHAAGLPVTEVPIRWDTAPWTFARLVALFRRTHPHAVLCHRLKDLKAAGPAARAVGVPVVLHTRESDVPLRSRRPYYRWYLDRVATGVLVNSEATRSTLLGSAPWLRPERVHLLYKGIDLERFRPGSRAAAPIVGFAGQWTERKGLRTLMRAWELLATPPGGPRLRLAGEGPLAAELHAWREGLPCPETVELLGHVEDMPGFLRDLRVLAMPSRAEGFGLAAAEALACGVPVVAGNASSLPEVVLRDRTGLLVPPDDASALAAALGRLLRNPALAAEFGRAGRADVVERFDRERVLDRLERLFTPPGGTP